MSQPNSLGSIHNSRTSAQQRHMEETIGKGKCPFCPPLDPEKNKVIRLGGWWQIWQNPFPYTGHQKHFVLTTIAHITDISQLTPNAWAEWGQFNQWAIKTFGLPGGGLVMRFGDNAFNGGTLTHIHSHIQVPDQKGFSIAVFFKDKRLTEFLTHA